MFIANVIAFFGSALGRRLLVAGAIALAGWLAYGWAYDRGFESRNSEVAELNKKYADLKKEFEDYKTARAAYQEAIDRQTDQLIAELTVKGEQQARLRAAKEKELKDVRKFVSQKADSACSVPAGYVRLLDLAAAPTEKPGAAGDSGDADAPGGVTLSETAEAVRDNYQLANRWRDQVILWQEWYAKWQKWYAETGGEKPRN